MGTLLANRRRMRMVVSPLSIGRFSLYVCASKKESPGDSSNLGPGLRASQQLSTLVNAMTIRTADSNSEGFTSFPSMNGPGDAEPAYAGGGRFHLAVSVVRPVTAALLLQRSTPTTTSMVVDAPKAVGKSISTQVPAIFLVAAVGGDFSHGGRIAGSGAVSIAPSGLAWAVGRG